MILTKSGKTLEDVIVKAMHDCQITNSEYDEIMSLVHEDSHVDAHEKVLLQELHKLIANKTVERVAG